MNKLARLKTILRNNKPTDVLGDKLDDNAVDSINIKDQSVIPNKIKDNSLDFSKMTDNTKFIATDSSIVALASCGGISEDDDIANKSIRDLLKAIILPYTPPKLSFLSYSITNNGVSKSYTSNLNLLTGTSIYLAKVIAQAMIRSDAIKDLVLTLTLNGEKIHEITTTSFGTFSAKTWKDVSFNSVNKTISTTNICDTLVIGLRITDVQGGETYSSKTIYTKPYVYYGNSNLNVTVDANKSITSNIDSLFEKSTQLISSYNQASTITLNYELPTQEYSYILLPGTSVTINTAIDQNNFTQNIEYVGSIVRDVNGVSINYKLFRTGISTMTFTKPTYKFNIVKE